MGMTRIELKSRFWAKNRIKIEGKPKFASRNITRLTTVWQ